MKSKTYIYVYVHMCITPLIRFFIACDTSYFRVCISDSYDIKEILEYSFIKE